MHLSYLEIFDLFLRFIAVGQLSILCCYLLSKNRNLTSIIACALAFCFCAYLLLTAPIANQHYGLLRGIFLFFTEFAPYLVWCLAYLLIRGDAQVSNWHKAIKIAITLVLIWFLYFFGYLQGRGVFHQINHALQLVPLLHVIYLSLKDLSDDLVNARRNVRIVFVMLISFYFTLILLLELGDASLRGSAIFSSVNAFLALLSSSIFSWFVFKGKFNDETLVFSKEESVDNDESEKVIPIEYQDIHQRLIQIMVQGGFLETQLTIKTLAKKLATPEHQLRELINKHLGFRNFSSFLNSYRLPVACAQLADMANIRTPILTIALELGYGSIATFNRAFKAKTGKTPKEYRSQFRK